MRVAMVIGLTVLSMFLVSLSFNAETPGQTVMAPDDVKIAFTTEGIGEPAVVLVHGWSCDRTYWRNQMSVFSEQYQVVAIDLAGHGDSGIERDDWTVEAFGGGVAAVIKKHGLEKVVLVGHSMGGPVNIEAARLIPDRVVGLVGVDTYHDLEETVPEAQRDQFLAAFQADFVATTNGFVRMMFPADADSVLVAEVADDMSSAPKEIAIASLRSVFNYKPTGKLDGLDIPVYAINADLWPTNVEAGKRQAKVFEVKLMPGRGHFVMLEDPDMFNTLLSETLEEIKAR
jgi:pimeloyl-ACP methyl ester carboxylesterase